VRRYRGYHGRTDEHQPHLSLAYFNMGTSARYLGVLAAQNEADLGY